MVRHPIQLHPQGCRRVPLVDTRPLSARQGVSLGVNRYRILLGSIHRPCVPSPTSTSAPKVERDGQTQYVDAKKNVWVRKLPPVLMLHLRRFQYNVNFEALEKVHDYYEYYEEIDIKALPALLLPTPCSVAPSRLCAVVRA